MARYLVEFDSRAALNRALAILRPREIRMADDSVLLICVDLSENERDLMKDMGTVYEDEQLAPCDLGPVSFDDLGSVGPDDTWKTKSLADVLNDIKVPQAWNYGEGEGSTLVIVDSGINGCAPEFPDWKRKESDSFSFAFGDKHSWEDDIGHGSMIACIAAARKAGKARHSGVAPAAKVISCRTDFGLNDVTLIFSRLVAWLKKGKLKLPLVINNSLGTPGCSAPEYDEAHLYPKAVRQLVEMGAFVVCAAGNNHLSSCGCQPGGDGPNTIWGVNSLDEVCCVGMINWNGSNRVGKHAKSSRGPGQWRGGSTKPDCVAPSYGEVLWGDKYLILDNWGTSGAAPLVSGLACLMLGRRPTLSPSDIYQAIIAGCRKLTPSGPTRVGAGCIDCFETMKLI